MDSKCKDLVIVESPAKAKTINRFLGSSFVVKASMGHVRDLPAAKLGVDIEQGFAPTYVVISGKKKVVKALKEAAAEARNVYLAPDMDREGEAIAWHLANLIGKEESRIKRVIFNEITERAIKEAFKSPTLIDMRKVDAQQARRVLDRLVGYLVSPLLWKVVHRRTSAGRVQSVALRLVCEREEAIARFVPQEYWTLDGEFRSPRGDIVKATLEKIAGAKPVLDTAEKASAARDEIRSQRFNVRDVESREKRRNPRAPYITSTLQQDGARRLGFSARKTMTVAQMLYEGIDLGDQGPVGLVTYMRTDSVRVAPEACDQARHFIVSNYGDHYAPGKATKFRKPKSSQDAHEAIRPTSVERTPESLAKFLTKDQARLYKLIWERFVASQMSQAVYDVTTAHIEGGKYLFRASGSVMKFDGFLKVYGERLEEDEEKGMPPLEAGEALALEKIDANRHETEPPPRYTESSLIKELEDRGIGRPSTYATIVGTIIERDYVEKAKGALVPTELGTTVLKIILKMFPDIFEVDFTARMESELDRIESGQDQWVKVISDFYQPFSKDLESADKMRKELKVAVEEAVEQKCETCGRPMVKKWGRHGRFLACSGFPECKTTKPLEEEVSVDARCPLCGGEMIVRTGRYGRFLACRSYPACKGTQRFTLGIKCPECGGQLAEKKTKRGRVFYGCQEFPKCKFATWNKPVAEQCPHCQYPIMVVKSSSEKGSRLECPKCKGAAEGRP